jgi:ferrochelatase
MSACDSVLLVGYGGPTRENACRCEPPCPSAAYCFVRGMLQSVSPQPPDPARIEGGARRYEGLGGYSPYNDHTFALAESLEKKLREKGRTLPVYAGMRYWSPWLRDTLREMGVKGHRCCVGVILAPHQSAVSWDGYIEAVEKGRQELGEAAPAVDFLPPWWNEKGLIEAISDLAKKTLAQMDSARQSEARLIFTAHSLPESVAARGPYVQQYGETAALVAQVLGMDRYELSYQSAPRGVRIPWLGPDVRDAIRHAGEEGAAGVVVAPIGFWCDHVEVLYDLDVAAKEAAAECCLGFYRVPTVGNHPAFAGMLAERIAARAEASSI